MTTPAPPRPPRPSAPKARPARPSGDPLARALAQSVVTAHGVDQAATLDVSEEIGAPRGYVGTRNIALDRALGSHGIPLGRITEVSGWPGAGKSTMLDQIIAQCQIEGGLAALADTERTRNRSYMGSLGVQDQSLIMLGGSTAEAMFEEMETLIRQLAHFNCVAWVEALIRAGIKCPAPKTYNYEVYDYGGEKKKLRHRFKFAQWGPEQAGALLAFQKTAGLDPTSIRDAGSRSVLRPVVIYADSGSADYQDALNDWLHDRPHHLAQPADRKVVVGWDSVAGTPTDAEVEGTIYDQHPATAAKVIRRALRRLVVLIASEPVAFILVNQRYERVKMSKFDRGPATETYGGGGIKYHTTVRIETDKVGDIYQTSSAKESGEPPLGQIVRIKIPKNKVDSPYRRAEYGLVFGRGADNAWAIFEDLKARGIIRVAGGWSKFTDSSLGSNSFRGWMDLSNMMADDPALWAKLRRIYMEGRA